MTDSNFAEGSLTDQMLKKYTSSRYYHDMLSKIVKEVSKDPQSQSRKSLFADTSISLIQSVDQSNF